MTMLSRHSLLLMSFRKNLFKHWNQPSYLHFFTMPKKMCSMVYRRNYFKSFRRKIILPE